MEIPETGHTYYTWRSIRKDATNRGFGYKVIFRERDFRGGESPCRGQKGRVNCRKPVNRREELRSGHFWRGDVRGYYCTISTMCWLRGRGQKCSGGMQAVCISCAETLLGSLFCQMVLE